MLRRFLARSSPLACGRRYTSAVSTVLDGTINLDETDTELYRIARDFAKNELSVKMKQCDEEKSMPIETLRSAGELGYGGLYVPEEFGGCGLSRFQTSIVYEALSTGCVSTTAYMSIHNLCAWIISQYGTEAQKAKYLPSMVSMQKLGSYCLTEPSAGSDAASLRTTARKEGSKYILNGEKAFISSGGLSDIYVVMARTGGPGAAGISSFLVPSDLDGIHSGKNERKMGWNSQPTRALYFDNCEVPAENIIGVEGQGFKIAMKGLDGGRINIASCSLGGALSSIEVALQYSAERQQFGKAIWEFQNTQFKLAEAASKLAASRLIVREAASLLDQNSPLATPYCAMAKQFSTDNCFEICNSALQILGGYGYLTEFPIQQYFRDTRVHQILEGTNEIMKVLVARNLYKRIQ